MYMVVPCSAYQDTVPNGMTSKIEVQKFRRFGFQLVKVKIRLKTQDGSSTWVDTRIVNCFTPWSARSPVGLTHHRSYSSFGWTWHSPRSPRPCRDAAPRSRDPPFNFNALNSQAERRKFGAKNGQICSQNVVKMWSIFLSTASWDITKLHWQLHKTIELLTSKHRLGKQKIKPQEDR